MKKFSVIIISGLILLFGCLYFVNQNTEKNSNAQQKVVDSLKREVMIPKHPQRVVILNASNLELFCAAGGAEFIVGKPTSQALSKKIQLDTKDAAEVGVIHSPDVEKILELKPDLVVGINVPFHHSLIPILEAANIPLYVRALDTYEDVIETLDFYGKLMNKEQKAQEQIDFVQAKYKQALSLAEGKQTPKNLIIWGSTESFNMATGQSFVGDLVNRLGGNNIADHMEGETGSFVPLSMEYIAKENPEVIFLVTHSSDEKVNQKFQNELAKHPAWQGIQAVKNGRVYTLPYELFAVNPGTQVAEAMRILAEKLYPEGK